MAPLGQHIPVDTPQPAGQITPAAKAGESHLIDRPRPWRQLYIFLIAADIVVLLTYFFLVPNDVWEALDKRLRALGSLVGSLIAYLGLKLTVQQYLTRSTFLDQTWLRAFIWLVTPIVWAAVLPVWSVHLQFNPPQPSQIDIQILSQSRSVSPANAREPAIGPKTLERRCQNNKLRGSAPGYVTDCVLPELMLRSYDVTPAGAPHFTSLSAASIFANTFTRRAFSIQLPCKLEIRPVYPGERIIAKRLAEKPEDKGILPDDGVVWLMPGRYESIEATAGTRKGQATHEMQCQADKDKLEIDLD